MLEALGDPDPQVQAQLLAQLRERGVQEALNILLVAIDSPHAVICDAVQKSLADYTFSRYVQAFDKMEDKVRRGTGLLVKKIDAAAIGGLMHELESESHGRRLRGLEMAIAMEAVGRVEPLVVWLLNDEDHIVRTLAAEALVANDSEAARQALQAALRDPHVAVRDAAENTLQQLAALRDATLDAFDSPRENQDDELCVLPAASSDWEVIR